MEVQVSSPCDGRIISMPVSDGEHVATGQLLATIG